MSGEKERRESIRINKSIEVSYRIVTDLLRSGSHSLDISSSGIRLVSCHKFEIGTVLALEIHVLEVRGSLKAVGEVVWVKKRKKGQFPYEIGIRFTEISARDKELLSNVCKKLEDERAGKIGWIH